MPLYMVVAVYVEQFQIAAEDEQDALDKAELHLGTGEPQFSNWHVKQILT